MLASAHIPNQFQTLSDAHLFEHLFHSHSKRAGLHTVCMISARLPEPKDLRGLCYLEYTRGMSVHFQSAPPQSRRRYFVEPGRDPQLRGSRLSTPELLPPGELGLRDALKLLKNEPQSKRTSDCLIRQLSCQTGVPGE